METILSLPTDKLIIFAVFSAFVVFIAVYAFRDSLADIAKSRFTEKNKQDTSSSINDAQYQILFNLVESLKEITDTRLTAMEKNLEEHTKREEEKFKGIDSKLDGGFRDLHARIDKLMDRPALG